MATQSQPSTLDPVLTTVMANRLDGIVREMTNTLLKAARSAVISSARDFSCCIITADDRLLASAEGLPVHIFRLAGIYGPGRSALDQIRSGRARRIDRPDHLFSRVHVDDIVAVLQASMARADPGTIYNVCDDAPAASADVVAFAAELLGADPPPLVAFEDAGLSPMARSFYADNRLVSNKRIKTNLGVTLRYPDFRTGLRRVLEQESSG